MKSLKIVSTLIIAAGILFSFSSCSKKNDRISKEQLVGKWTMILQGTTLQKVNADLKASGSMHLDVEPFDGVTDLIATWNVVNNKFFAHIDMDTVVNVLTWEAPLVVNNSMAGTFKNNADQNNPAVGNFSMDKQ